MSRSAKEKSRCRVVYEKTSGHLFIGDTNERLSPVIVRPIKNGPCPNGMEIEGNEISLCKASPTSPGVVYALQDSENVAFGQHCLKTILEGKGNSSFGEYSGRAFAEGDLNSFFGKASGWQMIDGSWNTFVGANSCGDLKKGERNVTIGCLAGSGMIQGNNNVFIGFNAKSNVPEISDVVALGYGAVAEKSNEFLLSKCVFTARARGLKRKENKNAEMLTFDQETGLLAPISYPKDNQGLKLLEQSDVLALDIYQKDGRTLVTLDDLEKLPQLSVEDEEGNVVGLNHANLLLHLLFSVQRLQREKGACPSTKQGLEALTKSFNDFRDSNFQNLSSINKTNEVLLAKLFQFGDMTKTIKEITDRQTYESGKRYSLEEKVEEEYEKQRLQNKVFGETLDSQSQEFQRKILGLEEKVAALTKTLEEKDSIISQREEKFEILSRIQDKRILALEEKLVSVLESAKKDRETFSQFLEKRPVSPLCVSAVGELKKKVVPLEVFEDWENISE
ncbi:hypothetical protein LAU_0174 [Lausannevirus]|uniref:Uncharacterized protein n=1 Tax=Lausannevirus TaxID=999883 RepID=F2WLA2_9VIRU|nr:hypothetical protein LAU_0174 [Lausannevirus]AEA07025.1 hypothetical protein LAU_0174 [Lausannevirus]